MKRLQTAQNYLCDAANHELSPMSREDCAFSAGYLLALEAIPASFTEKQQHPCPRVIKAAARCLGLDIAVMAPALTFILEQYSPARDGRNIEGLLAWAMLMKKAVDKSCAKDKCPEALAIPNERVIPIFAKISEPSNAHLFTAEAARKAFEHVKLPSQDEEEELAQVRKQLDAAIRVMQQREERRSNMVRGLAVGGLIAFVLAVLAIVFMR